MTATDSAASTLVSAQELLFPTYAPLPVVPSHGAGSIVHDTDGRDYVDLGAGIAVTALGHNPPELVGALTEQASKLWHVSNVFTNEPAVALAAKLTEHTFADRVFFSNSGAEANEAALKLARRLGFNNGKADKHEVIALTGSFHGRTLFTVSVGGNPKYKEGFGPALEGIGHVAPGDIDALRAAISNKTCAVIVEPVQGEGGVRPLDAEYLQAVRALCDDNEALLIFDEVQTGAGRTGTLFAYEQLGVTPDVLTSAKGLGGGIPIGATLASGPAAKALTRATHGTTFGGNPLACAVAGAVLDAVTKPEVMANVVSRHTQLLETLQGGVFSELGLFEEIRGMGLLIGAELADEWVDRAKELQVAALQEGVVTLVAGSNVLRFAPALNITEAELSLGLERLAVAAKKVFTS